MHPQNETRADWAENAADTFAIETYGGRSFAKLVEQGTREGWDDAYTCVQDLIGDLLHLAARYGWDHAELIRLAVANFEYEAAPDYMGD